MIFRRRRIRVEVEHQTLHIVRRTGDTAKRSSSSDGSDATVPCAPAVPETAALLQPSALAPRPTLSPAEPPLVQPAPTRETK